MGELSLMDAYVGVSLLGDTVKTQVQHGVLDVQATVFEIIGYTVPALIAVAGLTAGVKYAVKQVKGVLSVAS